MKLAGAPGFEPGDGGIKIRCLTTWLRPNTLAAPAANAGGPYICKSHQSTLLLRSACRITAILSTSVMASQTTIDHLYVFLYEDDGIGKSAGP